MIGWFQITEAEGDTMGPPDMLFTTECDGWEGETKDSYY